MLWTYSFRNGRPQAMRICLTAKLILTFAVLFAAAEMGQSQSRTIVYRYPWGEDALTFNPAKVNIQDLNRWMHFLRALVPYNGLFLYSNIYYCNPADRRYRNCGQLGSTPNKANAQVTLHVISEELRSLRQTKYPQGLLPIVNHYAQIQSFKLAVIKNELSFFEDGDIRWLEKPIDSVDPSGTCHAEIKRILASTSDREKSELVSRDWFECVWSTESAKIGPFPKAAWASFLAGYGISEKVTILDEGTTLDNDPADW